MSDSQSAAMCSAAATRLRVRSSGVRTLKGGSSAVDAARQASNTASCTAGFRRAKAPGQDGQGQEGQVCDTM